MHLTSEVFRVTDVHGKEAKQVCDICQVHSSAVGVNRIKSISCDKDIVAWVKVLCFHIHTDRIYLMQLWGQFISEL